MSFSSKSDILRPPGFFELVPSASNGRTGSSSKTLPLPHNRNSCKSVRVITENADDVHETWSQYDQQQLVDILHSCAQNRSYTVAKAVHGFVLRSYVREDDSLIILLNHVAYAYSKCSDFTAARLLFDNMPKRNAFSWTVMILGSTENGQFLDGLEFFLEMHDEGVSPDKFAYSAILKLCIGLGSIELAEVVHSQVIRAGFASNTFIGTSILSMYAKLGRMEESRKVLDSMDEPNEVSWNAIISGFRSNGFFSEAYDYYVRMKQAGLKPDAYTFISVLKAVGTLGDIGKGRLVHGHISETGIESNVSVGTALIDMYAKCGSIYDARDVFDVNFMESRVSAPWNAMISAYSYCGLSREALELYVEMCRRNIESDIFSYCTVFNSIATSTDLGFAREVHGKVLKSGGGLMVTNVCNAIANAYAKCGSLEDTEKVFKVTEDKDLISWTTVLTAYAQSSEEVKALSFFSQIREEGFLPNEYTYSSVLAACSSLSSLECGRQVHGLTCKAGMDDERCVESALIDMYAKCGSITDASNVFARIRMPDVVSWTSIISGYAMHGLVEDALRLFKEMERQGLRPNSVTFLSVLFACSHGGLVEQGLCHFHTMKDVYGITPDMEHYACIVDLLGRVGRLEDAVGFIKEMPIEPDEMIWQSLLGACRLHGNAELGKIAAEKIISFRPEDPAAYVLLSNTYIQSGMLEDGLSLRDLMKDQGMKKEPGCSWISVNGKLHKFYSRDWDHPERDEIYAVLEGLRAIVKLLGYTLDSRIQRTGNHD